MFLTFIYSFLVTITLSLEKNHNEQNVAPISKATQSSQINLKSNSNNEENNILRTLLSVSNINTNNSIDNPTTTKSSYHPTHSLSYFCRNFTNCRSCMLAESRYNVSCSWIQYDTNLSISTSTKNIESYNINLETKSYCTHNLECINNDDYHCCNHTFCCDCLEQSSCKMCGAQGLNESCTWDHTINSCFEEPTCPNDDTCLNNPIIIECEYPGGACEFYFSESGTTLWVLGYMGMVIFFICLPCCLYHKCGVDWDTEFSIPINDQYALQQGDGYVYKGGAHITGRCMYMTFLCIGVIFALLAVFGTILSISCMAESY